MKNFRLAVVDTNPVQYRVPFWRYLSEHSPIDVTVFYATDVGLVPHRMDASRTTWVWDIPLLDGYRYEFVESLPVPLVPGPTANRLPLGLLRRLDRGKFDAMLVFGYQNGPALLGGSLAAILGIPLILRGESHDVGRRRTLRSKVKDLLLPWMLRVPDAYLAIGKWNRQYWEDRGVPPSKIWVALYAVDNDRFRRRLADDPERPQRLRGDWSVRAGETVFLYCARLEAVKAADLLLDAFARLESRGANAQLIVVGSGPQEDMLKRRARELGLRRVRWLGFVNQADLPFHFRAADVMVLPSRFEPWGLVVNEAMACGTPCIVSDVVGAGADLVAEQNTGLVFRHDDPLALTHALEMALDDRRRAVWRAAIPNVVDRASYRQNADAMADCIAHLNQQRDS